jgi:deazaflavin-dependent oxidoreductase (nitroreductase family)
MPRKDERVYDNPTGWVAKHIDRYVETDGKSGHHWSGHDNLLLTTRGRKSGKLRRTALIYVRDGDRYLVVGSAGGAAKHPDWYLNLVEDPKVDVQVGAEKFEARARPADADEKPRLWKLAVEEFPMWGTYQRKTKRDIPVVIIERAES